ncbi:MAG: ABC-type polysaccharide/polyol phosphate transport system ATPase subunit [Planctomycetota bacterium]|jgi:ABC-type polysaccharide/polyol phosphate transport system ATPase subunit
MSSKEPNTDSAIFAENLGKAYQMYQKPIHRLWDMILPGKKRYSEFWAVKNVYLDIPHGSTVGIIGQNGAGKSTLLKLLTGISKPTTGSVQVQGRVASLLELGAGFHPEFSGRENIYLNCSILGMPTEEIDERLESIIAFSELGDFIERPVKTYSSGMYVRLGFSVAASVDPDIFIIDEALSVGDEHFKGKCTNRLNDFREQGKTIIFVSHDMGSVKSMCQRVVMMDQGEIVEQGSAEKVADEYLKRAHARGNERLSTVNRGTSEYPRWGSGEVEIHRVSMIDHKGEEGHVFHTGRPFKLRMEFTCNEEVKKPVFGIGIYRSDGSYINGSNHHWRDTPIDIDVMKPGESGEVLMEFETLPLLQGQYYITTFLYDHNKAAPTAIDHQEHALTFEVLDPLNHQHGMLYLPTKWTVNHGKDGNTDSEVSAS